MSTDTPNKLEFWFANLKGLTKDEAYKFACLIEKELASVTEERDRLRDEQFLSRGEALRAGFDGGRINEIVAALRDERDSLERALEEARNSEPDIALMEIGHLVKAKEGEHVLAAVHRLQENYQRIIVEVVACKPGQKVMVIEQPWDVIARMRNERNLAEQQLAASKEAVIEECAKVCEKLAGENLCNHYGFARGDQGRECAVAIRALSASAAKEGK